MRYKILHLPSATYMYWDLEAEANEPRDYFNYFYTEYEIENNLFGSNNPKNIFVSAEQAECFLRSLFSGKYHVDFVFDDSEETPPLIIREHFEIIEVNDNEI